MPYNFVANGIHTKKLCSGLLRGKCTLWQKTVICRFWAPSGGLEVTYAVHLKLIGKRVADLGLLLVILNIFCLVLRLSCYERKLSENRHFWRNGVSLAKSFGYKRLSRHQPFFLSEN